MVTNPWIWDKKKDQKQKKRKGYTIRPKQSIQKYSTSGSNSIKFINKPLSNVELLNWVQYLNIKNFRGVFSRDNLPSKIYKGECGIINLDIESGPGTHWVCYRNGNTYAEYYDSFGLDIPIEINKYLLTSGKQIFHPIDELQERESVLCGYWCLYFLHERQLGKTIFEVIHTHLSMTNQKRNHKYLIHYFKTV